MEWKTTSEDPLTSYVKHFEGLIGDQRTHKTFGEIVKGIIAAGSLICQQIAAHSAELSKGKKGAQRVIRLATGESTQRSALDAEHLTKRLREVAVEQLEQAPADELWLIADGSDLRKPYAEAMPYLMQVRDLDQQLVPGYRTLNVIGLTPGRRGLLYHRLFSSQAPEFVSEPAEVQQGQWHEGDIAEATVELRPLARVGTSMEVTRGKQVRPKKQPCRWNWPPARCACPTGAMCVARGKESS